MNPYVTNNPDLIDTAPTPVILSLPVWPGVISGPGVNAAGIGSPYTGMNRYPNCPVS